MQLMLQGSLQATCSPTRLACLTGEIWLHPCCLQQHPEQVSDTAVRKLRLLILPTCPARSQLVSKTGWCRKTVCCAPADQPELPDAASASISILAACDCPSRIQRLEPLDLRLLVKASQKELANERAAHGLTSQAQPARTCCVSSVG